MTEHFAKKKTSCYKLDTFCSFGRHSTQVKDGEANSKSKQCLPEVASFKKLNMAVKAVTNKIFKKVKKKKKKKKPACCSTKSQNQHAIHKVQYIVLYGKSTSINRILFFVFIAHVCI